MTSLLTSCWRRCLAVAAVAAFLTPLGGDSVVLADGDRETGEREARDRDVQDRERGERERARDVHDRERDDRERRDRHAEGDERDERERGDRERGDRERDRRDPEARERDDRDRAEGARRERPEADREHAERRYSEAEHARIRRHIEELMEENRAIENRARAINRERESLRDGQDEVAERLAAEMRRLRERSMDIRREIDEVEAHMRGRRPAGDRAEHPHREHGRADVERRVRHLRAAAENLEAAGMHDQARHLAEQIERIVHQHREGQEHEHRERPHHEDRAAVLEREVRELHGQMNAMREEIHHLREAIKELVGRADREAERD